jgi:hypothetical protein
VAKNLQTVARRALTPCAASDAFRFADGGSVRDLAELRYAVASKSAFLVAHHRGDYHAWIERTLGDPALARRVERLGRAGGEQGEQETFRAMLLGVLDERLAKLRDRVL